MKTFVVAVYSDGALRQQYLQAESETAALAEALLRFMRNVEGDMAAEYTLFADMLCQIEHDAFHTTLPSWAILSRAVHRAGYRFAVTPVPGVES